MYWCSGDEISWQHTSAIDTIFITVIRQKDSQIIIIPTWLKMKMQPTPIRSPPINDTESFNLLIDHISGWFNGQNRWIVSRNLTRFSLTMLMWFCYVYGYRSQIIKIKLHKNILERGPALSVVRFAWETRNRKWLRSFPETALLSCSFEVPKKPIRNSSKNILHNKRNQKPLKQVY